MPVKNSLVIILVEPQLGWNIGSVARAMLNFGLTEMRIVNPRDGWPNPDATATAAGADIVLNNAVVYSTFREAIADLNGVFAATARSHDMVKPVYDPRTGVKGLSQMIQSGAKAGVAFGGESSGLVGEDVTLCEGILSVPTNPDFSSLNLAQAVVVVAYEWAMNSQAALQTKEEKEDLASKEDLNLFFDHLERELDERGFLLPVEKRPGMVKNIRNIFSRMGATKQEVRTLRGIVRYLSRDQN